MAILKNCCCYDSVRKGSFASAIFTLAFYTIIFMTCAFHVNSVLNQPVLFGASIIMLILSVASVVSSVLLIVGLIADNHRLLIPWIISISTTVVLDIAICLHLMNETDHFNSYLTVFFIIDIIVCVINIYSLLCVISQYQEYKQGRGYASQKKFPQRLAVQQRNFLQVPNPEMSYKSGSDSQLNTQQNFGYLVIPSIGSTSSTPMRSRISTDLSSFFDDTRRTSILEDDVKIIVTSDNELNERQDKNEFSD